MFFYKLLGLFHIENEEEITVYLYFVINTRVFVMILVNICIKWWTATTIETEGYFDIVGGKLPPF